MAGAAETETRGADAPAASPHGTETRGADGREAAQRGTEPPASPSSRALCPGPDPHGAAANPGHKARDDEGPEAAREPGARRAALAAIAACAVLAAAGFGGWRWAAAIPHAPGPLAESRDIVVPPGGTAEIADTLLAAGAIDSALRFQALAWWTRGEGRLRAGEFAFPARASLADALAVLRTAKAVEHRIAIPEGLTARQIRALIEKSPAAAGTLDPFPEGAVLPRVYAFERGLARNAILARARAAMERELAAAWADRAPDSALASPRELLILASIVERETGRDDERARVAGVFANRLRAGMRLQSDATVLYAASAGAGVLDRPLSRADLERDDPFNTYRRAGLPPEPICAPGSASLRAAANPARQDELYFVADGEGGHAFAKTLEAHNRNVARWRARGRE